MSVMMIFSMSGVSVKAAQLQENNELKTVMVDMKDVATGDAIVYASTSTSTKTLSKDYATSTGQTGAITSIGQNVDFSSIIPQGSVIESITIYCPTGTRVTQSKYTTINNYLISSYETGTTATVSFKQTNSPSSTSKTTAFSGEAANVKFLVKIQGKIIQQYTGMDKTIMEACKDSGLADFISEVSLDYVVGQNGAMLSEGQKQKIALARALVHNSPVIIFDEATSNTDVYSEHQINGLLHTKLKEKTVIIITHKQEILKEADQIIMLKDGAVVGSGVYDDLSKDNLEFKNMLKMGENIE